VLPRTITLVAVGFHIKATSGPCPDNSSAMCGDRGCLRTPYSGDVVGLFVRCRTSLPIFFLYA